MKLTTNATTNIQMVKDLVKSLNGNGLLAQLTVAQAILEGGLRNSPPSELALRYSNLFGMKPGFISHGTADPGVIYLPTHEYHNGKMDEESFLFLSNESIEDSINQHTKLLTELTRYANLKDSQSFEELATNIRRDGYATDPAYTSELISVWKEFNLEDL